MTELTGTRYLAYARCSTKTQKDTSLDNQLGAIRDFAERHQMVEAAEPVASAVSASVEWNIDELVEEIIARKRGGADFSCVLIHDVSRLTRMGSRHALSVLHKLENEGIRITGVASTAPQNDLGDLQIAFEAYAAHEQVKSIARSVASGSQRSLEEGRRAHCPVPPYGVDKLVLSAEGRKLCVLRHLPDGSQEKYEPETLELVQRFEPNSGAGGSNHYRKAKQEKIRLCPGAPELHGVVSRIFRMHDIDRKGGWSIAARLNDDGVPSPRGGQWSTAVVLSILNNPVYVGLGIANRTTHRFYAVRSQGMPQTVERGERRRGGGKKPPKETRPRDQWLEIEEPLMAEYLPEDVRGLARRRIEQHLEQTASGHVPKPNERGGGTRSFLLTDILKTKGGGHPLVGHNGGSTERRIRYYKVRPSVAKPGRANRELRGMIPAEPVEGFVLQHLQRVLCTMPELADEYLAVLTEESSRVRSESRLERLRADECKLGEQIRALLELAGTLDTEEIQSKLSEKTRRRDEVRAEIESIGEEAAPTGDELRHIAQEIHQIGDTLSELPFEDLRRIVEIFVSKAEVDLRARSVEVEFAVPEWADLRDLGRPPDPSYKNRWSANKRNPLWKATKTMRVPKRCDSGCRRVKRLTRCRC